MFPAILATGLTAPPQIRLRIRTKLAILPVVTGQPPSEVEATRPLQDTARTTTDTRKTLGSTLIGSRLTRRRPTLTGVPSPTVLTTAVPTIAVPGVTRLVRTRIPISGVPETTYQVQTAVSVRSAFQTRHSPVVGPLVDVTTKTAFPSQSLRPAPMPDMERTPETGPTDARLGLENGQGPVAVPVKLTAIAVLQVISSSIEEGVARLVRLEIATIVILTGLVRTLSTTATSETRSVLPTTPDPTS